MTSPSEAVFECLLVFNQSGDDLESFSGEYRSGEALGDPVYALIPCVNHHSFLLPFASIWADKLGNGAGIHFQWAKKNTDFVSVI